MVVIAGESFQKCPDHSGLRNYMELPYFAQKLPNQSAPLKVGGFFKWRM